MVTKTMWADVRVALVALASATTVGCGLVLDTTPPPDGGPDGGGVECLVSLDCSHDACGGFERCESGTCVVVEPPVDCDDGLDCTVDSCEGGGCKHTPDDGVCAPNEVCIPAEGGCVVPRSCTSPAECDDGNACTAALDCVDSKCVIAAGAADVACPVYQGCVTLACNPDNGACEPQDTRPVLCQPFDDGLDCTVMACQMDGQCVETPTDAVCESLSAPNCIVPKCDPTNAWAEFPSGCVLVPDDTYCDASGPVGDCSTAVCVGDPLGNSDGCLNVAIVDGCSTSDQLCNLTNGQCGPLPAVGCTMDEQCDDGDPCNGAETCDAAMGTCQAGALPCAPTTGDCTRIVCVADNSGPGSGSFTCEQVTTADCFDATAP